MKTIVACVWVHNTFHHDDWYLRTKRAQNIDKIIKTNDTVIVDGNSGTIYVNPDEVVLHVFNAQIKDLEEENSHLPKFNGSPVILSKASTS